MYMPNRDVLPEYDAFDKILCCLLSSFSRKNIGNLINLKVPRTQVLGDQSKDGWLRNSRYFLFTPDRRAYDGFNWFLIVESANLLTTNGKAATIASASKTRDLLHGTYLEFHDDFGRLTWRCGRLETDWTTDAHRQSTGPFYTGRPVCLAQWRVPDHHSAHNTLWCL